MRRAVLMLLALAATPAAASTIILLPSPGSMASPRVLVADGDPDDIYVCSMPTEPGGGHCSHHKAHPHH